MLLLLGNSQKIKIAANVGEKGKSLIPMTKSSSSPLDSWPRKKGPRHFYTFQINIFTQAKLELAWCSFEK